MVKDQQICVSACGFNVNSVSPRLRKINGSVVLSRPSFRKYID